MQLVTSTPFLREVDALCEELQLTCGLTRFTLVIDRTPRPLTITLQTEFHMRQRSRAGAEIVVEIDASGAPLGRVRLEDSLAYSYPENVRVAATRIVARRTPALRELLTPSRLPPLIGARTDE